MFGTNSQIPCRNGPQCYYLQHGRCWFYHPRSHREQRNLSPNRYPLTRTIQLISANRTNLMENLGFFINQNNLLMHRNRDLSQQDSPNTSIKTQRRQQALKQIQKQQNIVEIPKYLTINGKYIQLILLSNDLPSDKTWFFKNSYHFFFYHHYQFKQCPICIQNFTQQQLISLLLCKHSFHYQCIKKWLTSSVQCPLCRKDFRQHDEYKNMEGFPKQYSRYLIPLEQENRLRVLEQSQNQIDDSFNIGSIGQDDDLYDDDHENDDYNDNYDDYEDDVHSDY